jgi:hypothetical protein
MTIADLLRTRLPSWLIAAPAATEAEIAALLSNSPMAFQPEYLDLLRVANGGEGELAVDPWWFQLWSTTESVENNAGYRVAEFHPQYWGFGTSGGGVMLSFVASCNKEPTVFGVPFDSIDPNDVYIVADSFRDFVLALGKPDPAVRKI